MLGDSSSVRRDQYAQAQPRAAASSSPPRPPPVAAKRNQAMYEETLRLLKDRFVVIRDQFDPNKDPVLQIRGTDIRLAPTPADGVSIQEWRARELYPSMPNQIHDKLKNGDELEKRAISAALASYLRDLRIRNVVEQGIAGVKEDEKQKKPVGKEFPVAYDVFSIKGSDGGVKDLNHFMAHKSFSPAETSPVVRLADREAVRPTEVTNILQAAIPPPPPPAAPLEAAPPGVVVVDPVSEQQQQQQNPQQPAPAEDLVPKAPETEAAPAPAAVLEFAPGDVEVLDSGSINNNPTVEELGKAPLPEGLNEPAAETPVSATPPVEIAEETPKKQEEPPPLAEQHADAATKMDIVEEVQQPPPSPAPAPAPEPVTVVEPTPPPVTMDHQPDGSSATDASEVANRLKDLMTRAAKEDEEIEAVDLDAVMASEEEDDEEEDEEKHLSEKEKAKLRRKQKREQAIASREAERETGLSSEEQLALLRIQAETNKRKFRGKNALERAEMMAEESKRSLAKKDTSIAAQAEEILAEARKYGVLPPETDEGSYHESEDEDFAPGDGEDDGDDNGGGDEDCSSSSSSSSCCCEEESEEEKKKKKRKKQEREEEQKKKKEPSEKKKKKSSSNSRKDKLDESVRNIVPKIDDIRERVAGDPPKKKKARKEPPSSGFGAAAESNRDRADLESLRTLFELAVEHLARKPDSRLAKISRASDTSALTEEEQHMRTTWYGYGYYNDNARQKSNLLSKACYAYLDRVKSAGSNERLLLALETLVKKDAKFHSEECADPSARCSLLPGRPATRLVRLAPEVALPVCRSMHSVLESFHFGTHFFDAIDAGFQRYLEEHKQLDKTSELAIRGFCDTAARDQFAKRWIAARHDME